MSSVTGGGCLGSASGHQASSSYVNDFLTTGREQSNRHIVHWGKLFEVKEFNLLNPLGFNWGCSDTHRPTALASVLKSANT